MVGKCGEDVEIRAVFPPERREQLLGALVAAGGFPLWWLLSLSPGGEISVPDVSLGGGGEREFVRGEGDREGRVSVDRSCIGPEARRRGGPRCLAGLRPSRSRRAGRYSSRGRSHRPHVATSRGPRRVACASA